MQRRKVQNRAAQRAYRGRKEKAISDLRCLLDKTEHEYRALQADHKQLQEKYEKLRAAQQDASDRVMTATCAPADLLSTATQGLNAKGPKQDRHGGN